MGNEGTWSVRLGRAIHGRSPGRYRCLDWKRIVLAVMVLGFPRLAAGQEASWAVAFDESGVRTILGDPDGADLPGTIMSVVEHMSEVTPEGRLTSFRPWILRVASGEAEVVGPVSSGVSSSFEGRVYCTGAASRRLRLAPATAWVEEIPDRPIADAPTYSTFPPDAKDLETGPIAFLDRLHPVSGKYLLRKRRSSIDVLELPNMERLATVDHWEQDSPHRASIPIAIARREPVFAVGVKDRSSGQNRVVVYRIHPDHTVAQLGDWQVDRWSTSLILSESGDACASVHNDGTVEIAAEPGWEPETVRGTVIPALGSIPIPAEVGVPAGSAGLARGGAGPQDPYSPWFWLVESDSATLCSIDGGLVRHRTIQLPPTSHLIGISPTGRYLLDVSHAGPTVLMRVDGEVLLQNILTTGGGIDRAGSRTLLSATADGHDVMIRGGRNLPGELWVYRLPGPPGED